MRIFVCSPYRGMPPGEDGASAYPTRRSKRNARLAEFFCSVLLRMGHAPFAPHVAYRCLRDELPKERDAGILAGLSFLPVCEQIWSFLPAGAKPSSGMVSEIAMAETMAIPHAHILVPRLVWSRAPSAQSAAALAWEAMLVAAIERRETTRNENAAQQKLSCHLPWPPSTNHYYRQHNGRTLISMEGRTYRRRVACELLRQGHREPPIPTPISVHILASPPDARRRDLDNTLKAAIDALQCAGVFEDDSQIADLRITRMSPTIGGRIEVFIGRSPS